MLPRGEIRAEGGARGERLGECDAREGAKNNDDCDNAKNATTDTRAEEGASGEILVGRANGGGDASEK